MFTSGGGGVAISMGSKRSESRGSPPVHQVLTRGMLTRRTRALSIKSNSCHVSQRSGQITDAIQTHDWRGPV